MSWVNQLFDAVRGGINNVGESIADANAIPALEQKMRDAKNDLHKAKSALTEVMAQEKLTGRKVHELEQNLQEYEGYAAQADSKGDETLLTEIIEKIGDLDEDLAAQRELHSGYKENVGQLKRTILETERSVKAFEREVKNIKATEAAMRASEITAAKYSGASSSMQTASERMERIKDRQSERKARMESARELANETSGDSLKEKMKSAGIIKGAGNRDDIMARIRNRKG